MITKTLIIVNGLTGEEKRVRVDQGITVAKMLGQIGLPRYELARVKNRQVLRPNCDVSRVVANQERLFAFAPIEFGGHRWAA